MGERAIGVDQTNESVIVGDTRWSSGRPICRTVRIPRRDGSRVLRDAGFAGMPSPWGLVTWQPPGGAETLVASVDEYLPDAVDGWTWAVELITDAARDGLPRPRSTRRPASAALVAELHAALAGTASVATEHDAARWRDAAFADTGNRLHSW